VEIEMIRISAIGGLGNQLFIWNLAHLLEAKYKSGVRIYYPKTGTGRKCEISRLTELCTHKIEVVESNRLSNSFGVLNRLNRKSSFIGNVLSRSFSIVQTSLPVDSFNFTDKPPRFINGYFQSTDLVEKAWSLYSHEILGFVASTVKKSKFRESDVLSRKMIHIRRGDFVVNKQTVGLLAIEYFLEQIDPEEAITILTDADSGDCEILKNFPNSLILGADSVDTWTSFSLLANSNYLIASNSTFSWWAGILSTAQGGLVIAPRPWTLTNVYGENYLNYEKFHYRQSIFEQAIPEDGNLWR
jgi:hypothetical protein